MTGITRVSKKIFDVAMAREQVIRFYKSRGCEPGVCPWAA